jgi:hypothetical protein
MPKNNTDYKITNEQIIIAILRNDDIDDNVTNDEIKL